MALACLALPVPAAVAADAPWPGVDLEGIPCEGGRSIYGPFDYTNPVHFEEKLPVVEQYHFSRRVETLQGGDTASTPLGDLNYTLRAFPNHHRALASLIRYYLQTDGILKGTNRAGEPWPTPPECYLQRAIAFQPKDAKVHTLYGIYLHKLGRTEQAVDRYRKALEIQPNSPETLYNLGLALVELGRYEEAQKAAREAYAGGYPLPALRQKLTRAGYPP